MSFSLVSQFPSIPPFAKKEWGAGSNDAIAEFNANWTGHLSLVERRLRVGVFGEFDAGKSTLINSLLGDSVLAVSGVQEMLRSTVDNPR